MSEQQKFNVGDWVRIQKDGDIAKVESLGTASNMVFLRTTCKYACGFFAPEAIEPWSPRVGERVRHKPSGECGVVMEYTIPNSPLFRPFAVVTYDETGVRCTLFDHLEPAPDEKPVKVDTPDPPPDPEIVGMPEVARLTGIDEAKIDDEIYAGRFPMPDGYVSMRPYWEREAIAAWIELRDAFEAAEAVIKLKAAAAAEKTILAVRVPAIGQRVECSDGVERCVSSVTFRGNDAMPIIGTKGQPIWAELPFRSDNIKPIGPDPRFVEITIREV